MPGPHTIKNNDAAVLTKNLTTPLDRVMAFHHSESYRFLGSKVTRVKI
jgi:hypothetical protein